MSDTYTDITTLPNISEPLSIQTEDYTPDEVLVPGLYLSPSRQISIKSESPEKVTFEICFDSGLENGDGRKKGFFERTYLSTKLYSKPNRPGKTSQVAEYLEACGFKVKGLSIEAAKELMEESQNVPVRPRVGRTNTTARLTEGDPARGIPATYEKEVLRTHDFNVGTRENPVWALSVVKDGKTYTARHRFEGWRKA
jgi:hypothetical protein